MTKRVMIFGAGSTGRGHIGERAHEAGWELILVDRDARLVDLLRGAGRYSVRLCSASGSRRVTVDRFRTYHVSESDALVSEAMEIPLILTAVFPQNLGQVAPLVAAIVSARCAAKVNSPLNVICCENMQNGSSYLQSLVLPLLSAEEALYAQRWVGFPDCMVSRVVPLPADPLAMLAEDYNEWTVDGTRFLGPPLDLPAIELVPNQEARLARKFFMHNSAHAVCGYWGFHRGHRYIHEAIADSSVLGHVTNAIDELAPVVARRYGLTVEATRNYGLELGARGANAELEDPILRVVRQPLRKLAREERLVAPAELAVRFGLPYRELAETIAAALHYHHADDPEAVAMRNRLLTEGPETAIPAILGLRRHHSLVKAVCREYAAWDPAAGSGR